MEGGEEGGEGGWRVGREGGEGREGKRDGGKEWEKGGEMHVLLHSEVRF